MMSPFTKNTKAALESWRETQATRDFLTDISNELETIRESVVLNARTEGVESLRVAAGKVEALRWVLKLAQKEGRTDESAD